MGALTSPYGSLWWMYPFWQCQHHLWHFGKCHSLLSAWKGCLYGSNLTCPKKCPNPSMIFHWALQTSLEEWSINLGIGNQFGNWFGIKLIGNQSGNKICTMAGFKNEPEHCLRCPLPHPAPDPHHTLGGCFPLTAHSSSQNEEEGTTATKASSQVLICMYVV